jgi:competence protein ComEC
MVARVLVIGVLVVANIVVFSLAAPRVLTVSFFDVGQGDAIFIESPTGVQMLIDGGVDRSALRALGKRMGFFDRTIDIVVATHPDADHVGGLVDVFERYDVGLFIESGVHHDTTITAALERAVREKEVARVMGKEGMRIALGKGVYVDILYPEETIPSRESNAGSLIMRVVYGEHAFMLTGDAPAAIEGMLVSRYGTLLESDVLKAGHHGSHTSSNEYFVRAVRPEYVIYSRGCDNRYGHPAPRVVDTFTQVGAKAFDTCENGTTTFSSNARTLRITSSR